MGGPLSQRISYNKREHFVVVSNPGNLGVVFIGI